MQIRIKQVYNLWIAAMVRFGYFPDIFVCDMFELVYYGSVKWWVERDFYAGRSYWVENELGRNWRIPNIR